MNRRNFLHQSSAAGLGMTLLQPSIWPFKPNIPSIASQQYPWTTFYRREGLQLELNPAFGEALHTAGFTYLEPTLESLQEVKQLAALMNSHPIRMRSMYVNCVLHDSAQVSEQIQYVLTMARAAQPLGLEILVTNPSPIRWGGPENKTDAQIRVQAAALQQLGQALSAEGIKLAYHTHDAEMRLAAREFHHMLQQTDPAHVQLCLDAHWIFRGAGDSHLALTDIISIYADRVIELHLRQSRDGIWTEAFGEGDIQYADIWAAVKDQQPWLVLEQAIEDGSPAELGAVAAHKQGLQHAQGLFR